MLNSLFLQGRLTKANEVKAAGNTTVLYNSLAVQRNYKAQNESEYATDFINIKAFGKTADLINKYWQKGDEILITGRLQQNSWQDKDGKNHSQLDVIVESVQFTSGRKKQEPVKKHEEIVKAFDEAFPGFQEFEEPDDIPF